MATMLEDTELAQRPVPPEVATRLAALRTQVGGWFLVEGVGRLLCTALVLMAVSFLLDYVFRLDLSQRSFLLFIGLCTLILAAAVRLVRPLSTPVSDDGLILEVERRNPQLREGLISAVQFARLGKDIGEQTSPALVQASIEKGLREAGDISYATTLNAAGYRRNLAILLLGCLGIAGIAAAGYSGVNHVRIWFERNLLLRSVPWPQNTYLRIPKAVNGVVRMARGDDYTLHVVATEDSKIQPERVFLDFRDGRSTLAMKKLEDGSFETILANVIQPFQFRVRGGDEITEYFRVELVEPPALEALELTVSFPEYTGGKTETLPSGKGPYFILPGSTLRLQGTGNKPLQLAALVRGEFRQLLQLEQDKLVSGQLTPADVQTGQYTLELTDQEGLQAKRPTTFGLRLRPDREPRVRARLVGIGGMVTTRARLPISCRVSDDYGLTAVRVDYRWRSDNAERKEGAGPLPLPGAKWNAGELDISFDDLLDLEPLAIPAGTGLEFHVFAADNDNYAEDAAVPVPNVGRSPDFSLRVVTDDELRSDLLRREKEQRQEFERLVKTQEEYLTFSRELSAQLGQNTEYTGEQKDRLAQLPKQQKLIATHSGGIATRLGSIVVEIENNRLENTGGPLQTRLKAKILQPLEELQTVDFPEAVKRLEAVRRATGDFAARRKIVEEAVSQLDLVAKKMREALDQMAQAEGFQEAVNLLFELQKAQQEVLDRTKKSKAEREKEIIEGAGQERTPPTTEDKPK